MQSQRPIASPSGLAKPDKTVCAVCEATPPPGEVLKRCQKCRTVPYCSKECQTADWRQHKLICNSFMMDNVLSSTSTTLGEKGPKGKKARTRGEILNDLQTWANEHNGDTLTVACWNAMNLAQDISKANTHFLAITLRRNATSTNPRAMYKFLDADILPLSLLTSSFRNMGNAMDNMPFDPVEHLVNTDKAQRMRDGALGNVLVMSFELAPGVKKTPEEALTSHNIHTFQPLGLFKVHRDKFRMLPVFPVSFWKQCVKNALDGGAYSPKFQPWPQ